MLCDAGLDYDSLQAEIPKKWCIYGDCLVLSSTCFKASEWNKLGSDLWTAVLNVFKCKRLVFQSSVSTDGVRTPQTRLVVGNDPWLVKTENKVMYSWDVTRCMYSAGNVSEKIRMSRLDCSDEVVVDMFAGIGYFTLQFLVHTRAALVHACEWNPPAVEALRRNLQLNRVADRCIIHEGDNLQVCPVGVADRVCLGLIPSSSRAWPAAVLALKPSGGRLHVHANVTSLSSPVVPPPPVADTRGGSDEVGGVQWRCPRSANRYWNAWAAETATAFLRLLTNTRCRDCSGTGDERPWTVHIEAVVRVKSYAPHIDHMVVDLHCCRQSDDVIASEAAV